MDALRFFLKAVLVVGIIFLFVKYKDEMDGPAAPDKTSAAVVKEAAVVVEQPPVQPAQVPTAGASASAPAEPGIPVDPDQALQQAMRAYKSGKEPARAFKLLQPFAEQGNASAQIALGDLYRTGQGVAKDDKLAYAWNRKAADQGSAHAQALLGVMSQEGAGTPQDDAKAVEWFRLAADQNLASAQYALGLCYLHGRGIAKDESHAALWLRRAAALGDNDAKVLLTQLKLP
jgi:TPR repeat protein